MLFISNLSFWKTALKYLSDCPFVKVGYDYVVVVLKNGGFVGKFPKMKTSDRRMWIILTGTFSL